MPTIPRNTDNNFIHPIIFLEMMLMAIAARKISPIRETLPESPMLMKIAEEKKHTDQPKVHRRRHTSQNMPLSDRSGLGDACSQQRYGIVNTSTVIKRYPFNWKGWTAWFIWFTAAVLTATNRESRTPIQKPFISLTAENCLSSDFSSSFSSVSWRIGVSSLFSFIFSLPRVILLYLMVDAHWEWDCHNKAFHSFCDVPKWVWTLCWTCKSIPVEQNCLEGGVPMNLTLIWNYPVLHDTLTFHWCSQFHTFVPVICSQMLLFIVTSRVSITSRLCWPANVLLVAMQEFRCAFLFHVSPNELSRCRCEESLCSWTQSIKFKQPDLQHDVFCCSNTNSSKQKSWQPWLSSCRQFWYARVQNIKMSSRNKRWQ